MLPKNLYDLSLFHGLTREQIDQILPLLEPCSFPEGYRVFQQELKASHFYILLQGEIVVKYKPYDGEELAIARICPEDVFGWSAPLGRSKYTSSAYAVLPCEAVRIDIDRMQHFCGNNSKLGEIILERLASSIAFRLRSTYDEVLSLLNHGMDLVPEK